MNDLLNVCSASSFTERDLRVLSSIGLHSVRCLEIHFLIARIFETFSCTSVCNHLSQSVSVSQKWTILLKHFSLYCKTFLDLIRFSLQLAVHQPEQAGAGAAEGPEDGGLLLRGLRPGHAVRLRGVGDLLLLRVQQLRGGGGEGEQGDCAQLYRLPGSEGARDGHLRGQPAPPSPLMSDLSSCPAPTQSVFTPDSTIQGPKCCYARSPMP